MSKFKHESKAAPTAWQGTELRVVLRAGSIGGHVTNYFDNDGGDVYSQDVAVADLPQEMQDCLATLAGLIGGEVEAEGYERDPHTRRKQEREAAKAAKEAEKAKAEEAPAEDPVVPEVG